jgi:hypothetical protein
VGVVGQDALFSEDDDEREVVEKFFRELDTDKNKKISSEELSKAMMDCQSKDQKEFLEALTQMMTMKKIDEVSLDEFYAVVVDLPRVKGQRVHWARTLGLEELLAKHLALGDIFDGLSALKSMDDTQMTRHVEHVCTEFSKQLPGLLERKLKELRSREKLSALEFKNSKFAMEGSFQGSFATLQDFYDGPEKKIGTPNPNVEAGMSREHCIRDNAREKYKSPNYKFEFMPYNEYRFVTSPEEGISYPHTPSKKELWPPNVSWEGKHGRDLEPLKKYMEDPKVIAAKLKQGEVVSLRLYTGPMYMLYNAVLRRYPEDVVKRLKSNNYETTIFCIISGVAKLSRETAVPKDRRVYRGLGGMILPDVFWNRKATRDQQTVASSAPAAAEQPQSSDVQLLDTAGFRGGVEWGLMSTTTDREVAMQYSGVADRRGTVFEISVGRIDIGADLSWVSQYPGEREILFPPLTCLEVVGEPRVETGVVVFSLRANMNLKGLTLEQLIERRKLLHLAMLKNLKEELYIEAQGLRSESLEPSLSLTSGTEQTSVNVDESSSVSTNQLTSKFDAIMDRITNDFGGLVRVHKEVPVEKFNEDTEFKRLITDAIDGKAMALCKMKIYLGALNEHRRADHMDKIFNFDYMELKSEAAQLQLKTGIDNFPWKSVVEDKSPKIDLGCWDASKEIKEDIQHVVSALGKNTHINSIVLKNVEVRLNEAWNTMSINMSNNAAVKELPATVALLLRNCKLLTSLDLRFATGVSLSKAQSNVLASAFACS